MVKDFIEAFKEAWQTIKRKKRCKKCKTLKIQPTECENILCNRYKIESKPRKRNQFSNTYFDISFGKHINTKDIDRLCKESNNIYISDEEAAFEAKKNKKYERDKFWNNFNQGLTKEIKDNWR